LVTVRCGIRGALTVGAHEAHALVLDGVYQVPAAMASRVDLQISLEFAHGSDGGPDLLGKQFQELARGQLGRMDVPSRPKVRTLV
jgi:hypothetical protein